MRQNEMAFQVHAPLSWEGRVVYQFHIQTGQQMEYGSSQSRYFIHKIQMVLKTPDAHHC